MSFYWSSSALAGKNMKQWKCHINENVVHVIQSNFTYDTKL